MKIWCQTGQVHQYSEEKRASGILQQIWWRNRQNSCAEHLHISLNLGGSRSEEILSELFQALWNASCFVHFFFPSKPPQPTLKAKLKSWNWAVACSLFACCSAVIDRFYARTMCRMRFAICAKFQWLASSVLSGHIAESFVHVLLQA